MGVWCTRRQHTACPCNAAQHDSRAHVAARIRGTHGQASTHRTTAKAAYVARLPSGLSFSSTDRYSKSCSLSTSKHLGRTNSSFAHAHMSVPVAIGALLETPRLAHTAGGNAEKGRCPSLQLAGCHRQGSHGAVLTSNSAAELSGLCRNLPCQGLTLSARQSRCKCIYSSASTF